MACGVNKFGHDIRPLMLSFAIIGSVTNSHPVASIESVKTPYLILGLAFVLVAVFFKFSSIPNKIDLEQVAAEEARHGTNVLHRKSSLNYPQLRLRMTGIFFSLCAHVST